MATPRWILHCALALSTAISCGAVAAAETRSDLRAALDGLAGGLAVTVGVSDAAVLLALGRSAEGRFLVHGLVADGAQVERMRSTIHAAGSYGLVSVERHAAATLPYADDLVDVLIVGKDSGSARAEWLRVLAPGGVLYAHGEGGYRKEIKPRPAQIDEWSHERHAPDGNPVSGDQLVGPPSGLRWVAGPVWPIATRKSSFPAMVSAAGVNYYVMSDEQQHTLVARNGFNGLQLWQRSWPLRKAKKGEGGRLRFDYYNDDHATGAEMPMVAGAEGVVIHFDGAVALFAADSGQATRTFTKLDQQPQDLLWSGDVLLVATPEDLRAFSVKQGSQSWRWSGKPVDVITDGRRAYLLNLGDKGDSARLTCVDLASGKQLWEQDLRQYFEDAKLEINRFSIRNYSLRLVHGDRLLVFGPTHAMYCIGASGGELLWKQDLVRISSGKTTQDRVAGRVAMAKDGLAWAYHNGNWHGFDLVSGEPRKMHAVPFARSNCTPVVATARHAIVARSGQFVGFGDGSDQRFLGSRGGCKTGFMPANGLLYTAPNGCACSDVEKGSGARTVNGFTAFESRPVAALVDRKAQADRLESGPATQIAAADPTPKAGDWPSYRHDARRSGTSSIALGGKLEPQWQVRIAEAPPAGPISDDWALDPTVSGAISSPVVAGGTVYVAIPHRHQIVALDQASGKERWRHSAGGRIDSPPTISNGRCLFGSRDGWVTCLRAEDGAFAWRFRLAPRDKRVMAYGQVESAWPVSGSVLVHDGKAIVCAGRNSYIDGGIVVAALDLVSGKPVWEIANPDQHFGHAGTLVSDGTAIYLGTTRIDPATGASQAVTEKTTDAGIFVRAWPYGLLHHGWTRYPTKLVSLRGNLSSWRVGKGAAGVSQGGKGWEWKGEGITAQMAVFDGSSGFGYQADGSKIVSWTGGELLALGKDQVEAMALAGKTLFIAGPTARRAPTQTLAGTSGFLRSVAVDGGGQVGQWPLAAPPVYDGLAVAAGRLYVSLADGQLLCFAGSAP